MDQKELLKKKVGFISLGCDKNRVDLEKMIHHIKSSGFDIAPVDQANIVVINTCSFIKDARVESIDTILNTSMLKYVNVEKIIVTGCINNMNYNDLATSMPEVDAWVKPEENERIVDVIYSLYKTKYNKHNYCDTDRFITTPNHYAYLKIADGCNNFCSYCTIPYIRGRFKSTPIQQLVYEATKLTDKGVQEIILVAQDVTKYGDDIYKKPQLVKLLRELSKIEKLKIIRLLYCYPDLISDELINEMAENDKIAKYIDMPLQHIDNIVLKNMNRRTNKQQIISIINKLREKMPDIKIRTTFIIGFPGETDENFKNLCNFVNDYKLDNVGFFKYSREEGTRAYNMPNQVPQSIKTRRLNILSKLQYEVVTEKNKNMLGKIVDVVVDEVQDKFAICRYNSCPEVDAVVFVSNKNNIKVGDTLKVKINKIQKYDLRGELL